MGKQSRLRRRRREAKRIVVSAGLERFGGKEYSPSRQEGLIKCRLWHGLGKSIIVPDQLFFQRGENLVWYQPRTFFAPLLANTGEDAIVTLFADIGEYALTLSFSTRTHIAPLEDGSHLYRCQVEGPARLPTPDGTGRRRDDRLLIDLFHHTSEDARAAILASGSLRSSAWNFQGTKKLVNVGYAYLTALPMIRNAFDLQRIAMSSDGALRLLTDDAPDPDPLRWRHRVGRDISEIKVYRESTDNRRATLKFEVDVTALAPQYLYLHAPREKPAYYEVCNPMIQRIATKAHGSIPHDGTTLSVASSDRLSLDYIVVGDATTLDGLGAPYDEENTKLMMKLERIGAGSEIARFWFEHGNTDLYSDKIPKLQVFADAKTNR